MVSASDEILLDKYNEQALNFPACRGMQCVTLVDVINYVNSAYSANGSFALSLSLLFMIR